MSENKTTIGDLFIKATRNKVRITTAQGLLLIEDLWDLSLTKLDSLAITLDEAVQKFGRKSFIGLRPKEATSIQEQFEIVKYVIDVKLQEKETAKLKADVAAQVAMLRNLRDEKKTAALKDLSVEEIDAQLAALES